MQLLFNEKSGDKRINIFSEKEARMQLRQDINILLAKAEDLCLESISYGVGFLDPMEIVQGVTSGYIDVVKLALEVGKAQGLGAKVLDDLLVKHMVIAQFKEQNKVSPGQMIIDLNSEGDNGMIFYRVPEMSTTVKVHPAEKKLIHKKDVIEF